MSDEQKIEKRIPEVTVGALIHNDRGEILLARGPKFKDYWTMVGGHLELDETTDMALKREIKEELGVEIDEIKFLVWHEAINPEFFHKAKHFIFLDFSARLVSGEVTPNEEISEFQWIAPEKALHSLKIDPFTTKAIHHFLQSQKEKDLLGQCAEYKQGWQRAVADYQNLQKEINERKAEWIQMSEQYILEEFLPVYDNFKKAWNVERGTWNAAQENWVKGIEYIKKQFADILKSHNVEEIKTVGEKFDPKLQETAGEEEAEGAEPGRIVREVEGGYVMNGRVIKVAKVIVAK